MRKTVSWSKLGLCTILAATIIAALSSYAYAETPAYRYMELRLKYGADKVDLARVKADPQSNQGVVIELMGTMSGTARNNDQTSCIINTNEGSYVVSANELGGISSGSKVCLLAQVGDKCTTTLSDLKLVAITYMTQVVNIEQAAQEAAAINKAEALKRQAQFAAESKQTVQSAKKAGREESTPERWGDPGAVARMVGIYKKAIKKFNSKLPESYADAIARSVLGFGVKYRVDPRLVVAVILTESHFRPEATSRKGAMGLGQLMPGTAAGLGVSNAYDPVANIAGSVRLIRGHLDKLSGGSGWDWSSLTYNDLELALASYNAGPGAVRKYGGVPPYRETRNYVRKVLSTYQALCGFK